MFSDTGRMGVDYDMASGGLIVRASPRMSDYLWVPNTGESTVSKWDATTEREVARYRVGLAAGECRGQCCYDSGCNQVSRVVVDGQGNAYAANRAFDMQGSVTKMVAERVDCIDRNMNGVIETSTGPMNLLPYGADECVAWTANVGDPNAVLRSITIDRGDEMFPEGYAWVGGCSNTGALDGNAGLFQLNPRTGATIRHVDFPACAYGAVVTTDGTIWEHCLGEGIFSVDPITGRAGPLLRAGDGAAPDAGGSYGIAADGSGRVWLSRPGQDAVGYDPRMRQWTWADIGGRGGTGLGITVDANNHVWVSGTDTAFDWDAASFRAGGAINAADIHEHNFAAVPGFDGVSAIGADRRGNIWMATSSQGPLVKYDPVMNVARGFDGPNQVYTYSDFTGSVRRLAIGTGSYSETYNTMCEPTYGEFRYTAATPMGTTLQFVLRTAVSEAGLGAATPVPLGVAPRDGSPIDVTARLLAAGVTPGQFARITVNFNPTNNPVQTPVLQAMSLQWRCPVNPG
jgi:streptogramin lyase